MVDTLHQIAEAEGPGSQGRKLDLLAGLLAQATPLEARYLLRLVTGSLRLGIGTPTILDALAQVYAGGRAARPVLERAYNICCDLGRVAAALVGGGVAAVEQIQVRPGNPVRAMLAQRLSDAAEILAKLGGQCAAEYKYDGVRVQAHRTADGDDRAVHPAAGAGQPPSSPTSSSSWRRGWARARRSSRGRSSPSTPAAGELRPFGEVMFRRRKHGIAEAVRDVPVGLFCFELLYADGQDLTRLPYPQRRAALAEAITVSPQLRLTTATEVADPGRPGRGVRAGGHRRLRGAGVQVGEPGRQLPGRRRAAGCGSSSSGTTAPSCPTPSTWSSSARSPGAAAGAGVYGALLLAAYDPAADVFRTVTKCGTGFSDAELAALPARLAPLARPEPARPGRRTPAARRVVRARARAGDPQRRADPLTELHRRPGARSRTTPGWRCGSRGSPGDGATTRPRRTPPPPTS